MELVRRLEVIVARWHEKMPHLPSEGRAWLAENIWWIALVGVILGGIGIVGLVFMTLLAGAVLVGVTGLFGVAVGGVALLIVLLSVAFSAASLAVIAVGIVPLKALRRRGWELLFIAALVDIAALVLRFLFSFNVPSLVWGIIGVAVGLYFIFEIRDSFVASSAKRTVKAAK